MQDIILKPGSKRIDFVTEIDWNEDHVLMKAAFPVDIRNTEATYDIQFGNVTRPTQATPGMRQNLRFVLTNGQIYLKATMV